MFTLRAIDGRENNDNWRTPVFAAGNLMDVQYEARRRADKSGATKVIKWDKINNSMVGTVECVQPWSKTCKTVINYIIEW